MGSRADCFLPPCHGIVNSHCTQGDPALQTTAAYLEQDFCTLKRRDRRLGRRPRHAARNQLLRREGVGISAQQHEAAFQAKF